MVPVVDCNRENEQREIGGPFKRKRKKENSFFYFERMNDNLCLNNQWPFHFMSLKKNDCLNNYQINILFFFSLSCSLPLFHVNPESKVIYIGEE